MDRSQFLYDVFISYSHIDRTWVHDWLLPQLEAAGLRVCIDERDFDLGVPSITNMERAVEQSRHTLLVLTPAWVASEWTTFEALLTQTDDPAGLRQRLLPLLLQPCQPSRHIGILTYADFTDAQRHAAQLQRVTETIQGQRRLVTLGPALRTLSGQPGGQTDRHRIAMISRMRQTWIAGVLDHSIAKEAHIGLGLEARPDAVIDPIDLVIQRPSRPPEAIPAGTPIIDIYDQLGGALLILGAPGAGKTTLLLELARDLLTRAEHDAQHPLPLIFPLSTWSVHQRPLEHWLVDELNQRYDVPRKLAQTWLDSDAILPLLDGLDEVTTAQRAACAEAINRYRQTHGLLPLVVCCRVADYEALVVKLRLRGAIRAQPLTHDQVGTYLRAVGIAVMPTPTSPLWELLDTPLMLSITALTYAGQPFETFATPDTPDATRAQLFAAYIDRMFQRGSVQVPFSEPRTRHALAWLAYQMQQHNQTTFYLENLDSSWLPRTHQRLVNPLNALTWGLSGGTVYGLGVGVGIGLAVALGAGLVNLVAAALIFGLGFGLILGLLVGLLAGLVIAVRGNPIPSRNVDALRWSWSTAWSAIRRGLLYGVSVGLGLGLIAGVISAPPITLSRWSFRLDGGLSSALIFGVGSWLSIVLGIVLIGGLSAVEINERQTPNQGIQRSLRHALMSGPSSGLILGTIFGLSNGLGSGVVFGLVSGVGVGLFYGGRAYLQHHLVRLLLIRTGSLPRRLVSFLDYATQRIFLRRVGGGYIFIHRLLLEHFAAQYKAPDAVPPLSSPAPPTSTP